MDKIEQIRTRVRLEEHGVANVNYTKISSIENRFLFYVSILSCKTRKKSIRDIVFVKERLVEDEQQTAISSGSSNPLLCIHYEGLITTE